MWPSATPVGSIDGWFRTVKPCGSFTVAGAVLDLLETHQLPIYLAAIHPLLAPINLSRNYPVALWRCQINKSRSMLSRI